MAAKKFYAVKVGRKTGIFDSWGKCYNQVNGYPGAVYKSFSNLDDAQNYLSPEIKISEGGITKNAQMSIDKINRAIKQSEKNINNESSQNKICEDSNKTVDIYVDGSYSDEYNNYSYAFVVVDNDKIMHEEYGTGFNPEACSIRNVAGELTATMRAVKYCKSNSLKCRIYHDYLGIAAWMTGEWKAKNNTVALYKQTMDKLNYKDIILDFIHVKGHSGNKYNERADKLCSIAFSAKYVPDEKRNSTMGHLIEKNRSVYEYLSDH